MKRKGIIIIILLLIALLAGAVWGYKKLSGNYTPEDFAAETEKTAEINLAPDFTVTDVNGNLVSLSDFKGKPVVINFWATWCPPCIGELPYFEAMYKQYGEKVEFMMVNLTDGRDETIEVVNTFIEDADYTFTVYYDTEYSGATAYGTYSIPVTAFVDKDGNLVRKQVGAMSKEALEAYILKVLG